MRAHAQMEKVILCGGISVDASHQVSASHDISYINTNSRTVSCSFGFLIAARDALLNKHRRIMCMISLPDSVQTATLPMLATQDNVSNQVGAKALTGQDCLPEAADQTTQTALHGWEGLDPKHCDSCRACFKLMTHPLDKGSIQGLLHPFCLLKSLLYRCSRYMYYCHWPVSRLVLQPVHSTATGQNHVFLARSWLCEVMKLLSDAESDVVLKWMHGPYSCTHNP